MTSDEPLLHDLCFGDCVIHLSQREVFVNGHLQRLSHAAFDLLIYLIERREFVVTKETLGKQVWGGRRISDKRVAKTVMQVRQAIGDRAAHPQWIRSVHGIGYRFVGEINSAAGKSATASAVQRLRLVLMPIENRTGEAQFVWIELGLATLVGQALGRVQEIAPASMLTVLRALGNVPATASVAQRVSLLQSALSTEWVVHAFIQRENGSLQLCYSGFCFGECVIGGEVSGHDAVQLGAELAQRLSNWLVPSLTASVRFESDDPFVSQLMGRAAQFYEKREWRSAMQFVRTALVTEPTSTPARLLLLRTLVQCADNDASALGEELLNEARNAADEHLEGIVHEALAGMILRRDFTVARHHLERALRLSEHYPTEEWAIRTRLYAAADAGWHGDFTRAALHYAWLRETHRATGDQLGLALTISNQATLSLNIYELNTARQLFDEACRLAVRHGWVSLEAHALGKLAALQASLGHTAVAVELFARAETLSSSLQDDMMIGSLLENSIVVYGETRSTLAFDRLLHRWGFLETSPQPLARAFHRMANGQRAACSRDLSLARRLMREAIDLVSQLPYVAYTHSWMARLLMLHLRADDAAAAAALCNEMQSQPACAANPELRVCFAHARAWLMHRKGELAASLEELSTALLDAPDGWASAHARLDAAWLALEQGRLPQAKTLVRDIAPWLVDDPVGLTVAARLRFDMGDAVQAVVLHRHATAAFTGEAAPWLVGLQRIYEAATRGCGRERPAALPHLISLGE